MQIWTFPKALVASYAVALLPWLYAFFASDLPAVGILLALALIWLAIFGLGLTAFGRKALWMLPGAALVVLPFIFFYFLAEAFFSGWRE